MSEPVLRMKAGNSQDIRMTIKEDRQVVPGDGFTMRILVMSDPQVDVSLPMSGPSTVGTIPRNAIGTPGMYNAEITVDNGAKQKTKTFKLLVDAHP